MESIRNSRRDFFKKAAFGTVAALNMPGILTASLPKNKVRKIQLSKNQIILFQGDSITDSGRNRDDPGFNSSRNLGSGYSLLATAYLLEKYPSLNLKIYNKGISGNKVYQLAERWDKDCIDIKPDILSILIGVNDIWHTFRSDYTGTVDDYRRDYVALIERTKNALPDIRLIICEPFGVKGVKAVDDKWYPAFWEYQKTAREIADRFDATFIPFQTVFNEAEKYAPGSYWTGDGVHPTLAGAQLMAAAWLTAFK